MTAKYSIYPRISIAHSTRLELKFLFLFLKVKSDHSSRFCVHFSDFPEILENLSDGVLHARLHVLCQTIACSASSYLAIPELVKAVLSTIAAEFNIKVNAI